MKWVTRVSIRAKHIIRGPRFRGNGRYDLWFASDDPIRVWFDSAMYLGLVSNGGWSERA